MDAPPLIERFATRLLRDELLQAPRGAAQDPMHVLSSEERAGIRAVVWRLIMFSAMTGALSTGAPALVEMLWLTGEDSLQAFVMLLAVTALCAGVELLLLYKKQLDATAEIAKIIGVHQLLPSPEGEAMMRSLARAALELSEPILAIEGVNPRRETPPGLLLLSKLLYMMKFTLSSFIFKLLLRRFAARSLLRVFVPLLASVPLMIFWNVLVSYWILREVKIRAVGGSAIHEVLRAFFVERDLSPQARSCLLRAVAVAVVKKRSVHPNLLALFLALQEGSEVPEALDDSSIFLRQLSLLRPDEQRIVLSLLRVAFVLDGDVSRREINFLRRAMESSGHTADERALRKLLRSFIHGDALSLTLLSMGDAALNDPR